MSVQELGMDADRSRHTPCAESGLAKGDDLGSFVWSLAFRTRRVRATSCRRSLPTTLRGGCRRPREISSRRDWGLGKLRGMPGAVTESLQSHTNRRIASKHAISRLATQATPSLDSRTLDKWCVSNVTKTAGASRLLIERYDATALRRRILDTGPKNFSCFFIVVIIWICHTNRR